MRRPETQPSQQIDGILAHLSHAYDNDGRLDYGEYRGALLEVGGIFEIGRSAINDAVGETRFDGFLPRRQNGFVIPLLGRRAQIKAANTITGLFISCASGRTACSGSVTVETTANFVRSFAKIQITAGAVPPSNAWTFNL